MIKASFDGLTRGEVQDFALPQLVQSGYQRLPRQNFVKFI